MFFPYFHSFFRMSSSHPPNQGELCKYFASGVCKQGDRCQYSHDRNTRADNVCRFYVAGSCNYGASCRYDHVKPKKNEEMGSSQSGSKASTSSENRVPSRRMPKPVRLDDLPKFNVNAPVFVPSWIEEEKPTNYAAAAGAVPSEPVLPLCPYFEMGDCPKGDSCQFVHGDLCEYCNRACLHPFDELQRYTHSQECMAGHELACETAFLEQRSAEKECGICLEKIYEKNLRFGVLENCTHCFCLDCIRKWRKEKELESDVIRSCPECRIHSHYVIPSVVWVEDSEEKTILVDAYKENTGKKVCKYYQNGRTVEGCPFGNKCFYRHQLPDGTVDPGEDPGSRRKHLLSEFIFPHEEEDEEVDDEEFLQRVLQLLRL